MKKKPFFTLGIVMVGLLSLFAVWTVFVPIHPGDGEVVFYVNSGESPVTVAEKLYKNKLVRSKLAFLVYTRITGIDKNIKAGKFIFTDGLSMPNVARHLTNAQSEETELTVPEGFTMTQIDQRLAAMGLIQKGQFKTCANQCAFPEFNFLPTHSREGFFFPDTYFVSTTDFSSENLLRRAFKNFNQKFTGEFQEQLKKPGRTLDQIVTMASIVEKEVATDKDYPVVAGILWKRFDNNWPLGADATLLYEKSDRDIDYFDLQENSPYNTRKILGFPPTPINNPGLTALRAALYPEESPYWFYLTTSEGKVIYARTNEEHNQNKRRYL